MKQLIIAEKPSLAKKITDALKDNFVKKDGYYDGENYVVTFAFGHLFQLKDIEQYENSNSAGDNKWDRSIPLPYVPETFEFALRDDDGVKKQFGIIKSLVHAKYIDTIINCGDADREGEIIIRIILNAAGSTKPVKRLWLPDQSEQTICEQISALKNDCDFDNLSNEGYARTYMDWLLGINLTRHLTYMTGTLLPVGRVLIPIVKAVFDRDKLISEFVPSEYFHVQSNAVTKGEKVRLQVDRSPAQSGDKSEATDLALRLNGCIATVTSLETNTVVRHPSKLFSLSKLQSFLSKKHKMPLKQSLATIQKLYETGYITYPRTNTEYLSAAESNKMGLILQKLVEQGHNVALEVGKACFNDSKIESHSAITPTLSFPKCGELEGESLLVYETIKNRFICNFLDCKTLIDRTEMKIVCGEMLFTLKGDILNQKGFFEYEPRSSEDDTTDMLPNLAVGDTINVDFVVSPTMTKPPKKLNAQAMMAYLSNPFKQNDNEDIDYEQLLKGVEIGTQATRTNIIENAKNYKYISEVDTVYSILPLGMYLIRVLGALKIDLYAAKTVEFSQQLKSVGTDTMSTSKVVEHIKMELESIMTNTAEIPQYTEPCAVICSCPICGKNVYENVKIYYCSDYKNGCKFTLWKQNKFFEALGKPFTNSTAVKLLKTGKCSLKGCTSKSGKTYDAVVLLSVKNGSCAFELQFDNKKSKPR